MYMGLRNLGLVGGVGASSQTDLQRLLALSPSLLIWPAQGAGWQGTSGGTLAASGQPVGLVPDLSQLGGKTLGEWLASAAELVTNGGFDSDTAWTKQSGWTIGSGVATGTALGASVRIYQPITTVVGRLYRVTYTVSANSGTGFSLFWGNADPPTTAATFYNTTGTFTDVFVATATTSYVGIGSRGAGSTTLTLDNVSVVELPGNHLRAGTWASPSDAARGTFQNDAINFGGVDDYYSLLNAISITENMTVVRAFKRASAGIHSLGISNDSEHDLWFFNDNKQYVKYGATQTGSVGTSTATGSFVGSSKLVGGSGGTQSGRLNGVEVVSGAQATRQYSFTQIGKRSTVYNSGEISFLALFPTELTGADLAFVEQIAASTNGAVLA